MPKCVLSGARNTSKQFERGAKKNGAVERSALFAHRLQRLSVSSPESNVCHERQHVLQMLFAMLLCVAQQCTFLSLVDPFFLKSLFDELFGHFSIAIHFLVQLGISLVVKPA